MCKNFWTKSFWIGELLVEAQSNVTECWLHEFFFLLGYSKRSFVMKYYWKHLLLLKRWFVMFLFQEVNHPCFHFGFPITCPLYSLLLSGAMWKWFCHEHSYKIPTNLKLIFDCVLNLMTGTIQFFSTISSCTSGFPILQKSYWMIFYLWYLTCLS